ncbi:MAG: nuclear transport factor 2 family protein [Myxococcota bacterium]
MTAAEEALAHCQIQTLLSVYYHALDAGDLARLEREVMAEDATWHVVQVAGTGRIEDTVSGRDAVIGWFRAMLGGGVSMSDGGVLHFLSTHAIRVDGDRATSTSHLQAVSQATRAILATGVCEAEHVRTREGWRIRHYRVTERITDADLEALKATLARSGEQA